jgi:hypothetical protein
MKIASVFKSYKTQVLPFVVIFLSITEAFLLSRLPGHSTEKDISAQTSLPQAYLDAVEDAKIAEYEEIWRNLTAIVRYNPKLKWESERGNSRVLVAIWTSRPEYENNVGKPMILTQNVWVTAVPDLKDFCKTYNSTGEITLPYRLNQLLGLPPDSPTQTRKVVEVWVAPKDLFRPSPDPEITDHEAELDFPPSNRLMTISILQGDWFKTEFKTRYTPRSNSKGEFIPYPWTRLGYTYDWGKNTDWKTVDSTRPAHVGLSEFVISESSQITVHSVNTAETYCQ